MNACLLVLGETNQMRSQSSVITNLMLLHTLIAVLPMTVLQELHSLLDGPC